MICGLTFVIGASLSAIVFSALSVRAYNRGYKDGRMKDSEVHTE